MIDGAISLPLALLFSAASSVAVLGVGWGAIRTTAADTRRRLDTIERDVRETFNRLAHVEKESVTRENLAEFRREIIAEIHALRDLIEKVRPPHRARASSE